MRGGKRDNSGRRSGWGTNVKTVAIRVPERFLPEIEKIKEHCVTSKVLEWPRNEVCESSEVEWGEKINTVTVQVPEQLVGLIEELRQKCLETGELRWMGRESLEGMAFWCAVEGLEKQICSQEVVEQKLIDANGVLNEEKKAMEKWIEELEKRPVTSGSVDSDSIEPIENLVISLSNYIVNLEKTIEEMREKLANAQEVGKTALNDLDELTQEYEQLQKRIGLPEDF